MAEFRQGQVGSERPGNKMSNQEVWKESLGDTDEGGQLTAGQEEKAVAKGEMESEIARLWEEVSVAREEQKSFLTQVEDLRAKVAADEGTNPEVTGARIAALREYEQYLDEAATRVLKNEPKLKALEAQYQTVFGAPFVQ